MKIGCLGPIRAVHARQWTTQIASLTKTDFDRPLLFDRDAMWLCESSIAKNGRAELAQYVRQQAPQTSTSLKKAWLIKETRFVNKLDSDS